MSFTAAPIGNQPLYGQPAQITQTAIFNRLLNALTLGLDVAPGSLEYDLLSSLALELAQAAQMMPGDYTNRVFTATSYAPWLDYRAQERGLSRLGAAAATVTVQFTAAAGQAPTIPAGTRVGTNANPSVVFTTSAALTLPTGGSATVSCTAQVPGSAGNVAISTITQLIDTVAGVQTVVNTTAATGGTDQETDSALRARILLKAGQPPTTGNQYQYQQAALAVSGVGQAQVVRAWNGPGNVAIALVDPNGVPVGSSVITAVENAIINPWRLAYNADQLVIGGFGGTADDTSLAGGSGHSDSFIFNASGVGTLTHSLSGILTQPGIWRLKINLATGTPQGTGNLVTLAVQYAASGLVVPQNPPTASTPGSASATYTAAQIGPASTWGTFELDFYWDGINALQFVLTRLQADGTTKLYVDTLTYISAFSRDDQPGVSLCALGDRVMVQAATAVTINVAVHLDYAPGAVVATVQSAIQTAVQGYIKGLALQSAAAEVVFGAIAGLIANVSGVQDFGPASLLINGAQQNVTLQPLQIPTLGVITYS